MKDIKSSVLFIVIIIILNSCKENTTEFATKWSIEIKNKIIEDSNQKYDRIISDTSFSNLKIVSLFKGSNKLKEFRIRKSGDTVASVFYIMDQHFKLIRELCPALDRSFEGITFNNEPIGLTEFRYCNGQLKEQGLRDYGNIGVWKLWDSTGKFIKQTDYGHIDKLEKLRSIRYSR